jgi:S-ribosylhomocysteine lyase
MGCQTGFYLLIRDAENNETLRVVKSTLEAIINHDAEMPGAKREECGNYKCLDMDSAKAECRRYLDILNSKENTFNY